MATKTLGYGFKGTSKASLKMARWGEKTMPKMNSVIPRKGRR